MNGKFITILLTAVLLTFGFGQVSAQTCTPASVGLVSAYSGDSNALDARSRNNGTIQGNVSYATGNVGQGFQLSGANGDRVLVGNPANLRLQEFTIEAWIKRSSLSVVSNSPNPGSPAGIFFAYGQNGYAFLIDQNTNRLGLSLVGVSQVITPTLTITDTNWHHVAVVRSGSQTVFYLDGVADTPVNYAPSFSFTTNAAIGSRGDGQTDNVFFGAIDELGIYNRPLAASEIQAIFNSGTSGKCKPLATVAPDNQVLWLAGDGDALDSSSYGNNGSLQNGASYAVGRVGQSFTLDGLDDTVSVPNNASVNFAQTAPMSVEMWVYRTSTSQIQHFIGKRVSPCVPDINYQLALNTTNGQGLIFGGQGAGGVQASSGQDLPLNTWTHLAGTSDGSTVRLYINGVLAASANGTLGMPNSEPLIVGGSSNCPTFSGKIDEVSIYSRALSADEIQAVSNAGLAGKYKVQSTVPDNLVAWYSGDGNPNDLQGANNGTLENGAGTGNGKVGQGFQFDGVDDQITVPHNANQNGGTNLTIESWINPSSLPHGATILQKRTSGNVGGYVFEPTQAIGGGNTTNGLSFVIMIGGSYQFLFTPANVLTTNAWQHVAATYDGAFMRIYVNGVEVANKPQTGTIDASTAPVVIGRNAVSSAAFQGGIDEIALYNRALSANEIRDIYSVGNGGKYKLVSNPTVANKVKTGEAEITFGGITIGGAVHQTPIEISSFPALPMGTNTGLNYDISTSAAYTNPTVCFNVPSFTPTQFPNLRIYHLEAGAWQNRTATSNTYPNLCTVGLTSLSPFVVAIVAPSAANASISGHVVAGKGGLSNVIVTLSGGNLTQPISARTNNFGFYKFDNLPVGETYVLTVSSKKYVFTEPTQTVNLLDEITDADFTAENQ